MADRRRTWRHLPWAEIRAAWLRVESVRELAARYGMSETTLSSRAHRAGWGKRKRGRKPRVDRAQFAETWAVTRSPARVALEVGITREAAHRLARRLGLPPKTVRRPDTRKHVRTRPIVRVEPQHLYRCEFCERLNTTGWRCGCPASRGAA